MEAPSPPSLFLLLPFPPPMAASVILLPMAITFYVTWGFVHFVDGFFSPIYDQLGINVFGVFMSSWWGASVLTLGEWFIKKMPLVSYIYAASKQISTAISPDQNSNAFKEVAIVRHPRMGQYMFGFITSTVVLQKGVGEEELCCVYIPTNHLYLGDIFLFSSRDILRPNLVLKRNLFGFGLRALANGVMAMSPISNAVVLNGFEAVTVTHTFDICNLVSGFLGPSEIAAHGIQPSKVTIKESR
ncbi:hypothetical protein COLO4_26328 [Corchorus olitorius]|uniref:Uncharacterized protein n=1 Tax=Corchorus olitorius TaxID=93759 RepID=A0A1R3HXN7_9ROSI|nr:hypothetical protein COLO4_26328 [Corchorus olitorius]